MKIKKENFELKLADKTISVRLGGLADQASGCNLISLGETSILAVAQIGQPKPEMGYFPLTCAYLERFYAAGKILGSRFVRREGRPPTEAVLKSRIIDRAIRPLFPQGMTNEIQIVATCLTWDKENDPAILGLNGASLSLGLSEIPWAGPVGAVRVGHKDGQFILNPTYDEREQGGFDLLLVGTESEDGKEVLINMIEAGTNEVPETQVLGAYDFAMPFIKEVIEFQKQIIKKHGQEKRVFEVDKLPADLEQEIKSLIEPKIEKALYQKDKTQRNIDLKEAEEEMIKNFDEKLNNSEFTENGVKMAKDLFEQETENIFKKNIIEKEKRPDLRRLDEVREITAEVAILPRVHGSGMFARGATRILSIATLGSPGDQQLIESMEISGKKRFMHHYNFPPYSSGETGRMGFTGRREIGHGALAEKAIEPLLPSLDDFPYTIRVVSESLSSNGSTSMASVSGTSLALMDVGVPLKRTATGIAIGLVIGESSDQFKLLTDIQGPEDHYGEMDFKVAGTNSGITAVQMDVKTMGITREMFEGALEAAKKARLGIIKTMEKAIDKPRKELSKYAPRVYTLKINPDKIGAVIGSGGKVINEIIEKCEVGIDIDDDGTVFISAEHSEGADKAIQWVKDLTRELEVGETFEGKIVKIMDFGAFVELVPGQDGLVHISEFVNQRINRVDDVVKEGKVIPVKIVAIDDSGKVSLSAKQAGFKPSRAIPSGSGAGNVRPSAGNLKKNGRRKKY